MKTVCTMLLIGAALLIVAPSVHGQIDNIYRFLEACRDDDPAVAQVLRDFTIRSNGVVVTEFPCQAPISSMTVSNYTDPLTVSNGG